MRTAFLLFVSIALVSAVHNKTSTGGLNVTYQGVVFTHCGSGATCGGNQKCSNYELALNNGPFWYSMGLPTPSGGVSSCPTSYFDADADCCNWATCPQNVRDMCPSCPIDGYTTQLPVCVASPQTGKRVQAYITGCCPSNHPCNTCKNQFGVPGGCNNWDNQADLCDNLWYALGMPSQSTTLDVWQTTSC